MTSNRIIFIMTALAFIVVFGAIPFAVKYATMNRIKFEGDCKGLNGELLKGDDSLLCIKPGSIIEVPRK